MIPRLSPVYGIKVFYKGSGDYVGWLTEDWRFTHNPEEAAVFMHAREAKAREEYAAASFSSMNFVMCGIEYTSGG